MSNYILVHLTLDARIEVHYTILKRDIALLFCASHLHVTTASYYVYCCCVQCL